MKRRDFLRTLLAITVAPVGVAAAAVGLSSKERDPHKRLAAAIFGTCSGRISCKHPNMANWPKTLKAYSETDARVTLKMMQKFQRYEWHYGGRVHDSICFEQIGGTP